MKIIIKQKTSGTGTIYDIESSEFDRVIDMGDAYKYAVVTASHYNMAATRHKKMSNAVKSSQKLMREGYTGVTIIDTNNRMYDCDGYSVD